MLIPQIGLPTRVEVSASIAQGLLGIGDWNVISLGQISEAAKRTRYPRSRPALKVFSMDEARTIALTAGSLLRPSNVAWSSRQYLGLDSSIRRQEAEWN